MMADSCMVADYVYKDGEGKTKITKADGVQLRLLYPGHGLLYI